MGVYKEKLASMKLELEELKRSLETNLFETPANRAYIASRIKKLESTLHPDPSMLLETDDSDSLTTKMPNWWEKSCADFGKGQGSLEKSSDKTDAVESEQKKGISSEKEESPKIGKNESEVEVEKKKAALKEEGKKIKIVGGKTNGQDEADDVEEEVEEEDAEVREEAGEEEEEGDKEEVGDEEELGIEYLVKPVGPAEEDENSSDFKPKDIEEDEEVEEGEED